MGGTTETIAPSSQSGMRAFFYLGTRRNSDSYNNGLEEGTDFSLHSLIIDN